MDDRHEPLSVLAFALDDGVVPIGAVKSGGRGKPESRGRRLANPNKSLLVMAVEKRPVGPGFFIIIVKIILYFFPLFLYTLCKISNVVVTFYSLFHVLYLN